MIARAIPLNTLSITHQHNAMRPRHDGLAEFSKKKVHRGGIEPGHHQGHTGVACRAYGADDPSRLVADPLRNCAPEGSGAKATVGPAVSPLMIASLC
jgi:hypothetical protein